jgi:ribonuclease J
MNSNDVKLCIHQAADTIGGNCIEIVAPSGERLLLDAGRPLDAPDGEKTQIPLTLNTESPTLGIILTHSHLDHYGLLESLPEEWPVYCGKGTKMLMNLRDNVKQTCNIWENRKRIEIGPFNITPYLIDHSAFDAYAILIDVNGKRIFYSGDFRAHGRKSYLTKDIIEKPLKDIDVMIMEGTNLMADEAHHSPTLTEEELEQEFINIFNETKGRVFISYASSNIDRVVTIYKACINSRRIFVPDLYTIFLLMNLKSYSVGIPQPEWQCHGVNRIRPVVTKKMMDHVNKLYKGDLVEDLKKIGVPMSANKLTSNHHKWAIMAKKSLINDFKIKGVIPNKDDAWIWSMWTGYLEEEDDMKEFLAPCKKLTLHSSGHATPEILRQFAEAIKPKMLIPIHGHTSEFTSDVFSNMCILHNGEWINI